MLNPAASLTSMRTYAVSRTRRAKRGVVMLVDAGLCAATCALSVVLRLGALPTRDTPLTLMIAVSVALALPIFSLLSLYREIFSQTGLRAVVAIGRACALYTLPFAALFAVVGVSGAPRTVGLIQPILLFVAIAASRLLARHWLVTAASARPAVRRRVLIYGAGAVGRQLAGAVGQSADMELVGFLDDSPALIGAVLDSRRIHAAGDLRRVARKLGADEILLALPPIPQARRRRIIDEARQAGARVRTLPGMMDLAQGRIEVAHIRDIEVEDLLGRERVEPDQVLMRGHIHGKVVMVTGAGGSIGGELCRQLLAHEPATLLLVDISEFGLYEIDRELSARPGGATPVVPLLGSVLDEARMEEIIAAWRPHAIYHAAAYKHVPLVELNPAEGVRTNVLGTLTLACAAARWRTPVFILVSTDKAVRPTNVMGATKRAAELVLQALNRASPATRFSMVRFGNVLGSSGSVIPLFKEQIRRGGPVTLTDRRITRFFMTAPEAAQLVLQAGAMATGGEVFVLDMGQPVQIAEMARQMIELAGLTVRGPGNPAGDIEVIEVGLRPGEKLYEELLIGDAASPTGHPRIWKADETFLPMELLRPKLDQLAGLLASADRAALIAALQALTPEFQPAAPPAEDLGRDARPSAQIIPLSSVAQAR